MANQQNGKFSKLGRFKKEIFCLFLYSYTNLTLPNLTSYVLYALIRGNPPGPALCRKKIYDKNKTH